MTDAQTLIARVEAGGADDQGELLIEAFGLLHPEPAPGCEPVWRPENPKQPIYHAWKTREIRFNRMVVAEAFESAAMLLVPDGLMWTMDSWSRTQWSAGIWRHQTGWLIRSDVDHQFRTPALALTAAALRAHAVKLEDGE